MESRGGMPSLLAALPHLLSLLVHPARLLFALRLSSLLAELALLPLVRSASLPARAERRKV